MSAVPQPPEPPTGPRLGPPTTDWSRLDPRMLLVHPVREVVRFLPALVGIVILGRSTDSSWELIGVAVPVGLGLLRYATTTYRIGDTQIELRRGLVQRSTLTARIDRVRTVELTSTLIHRVLGLSRVTIGTGSAAKKSDENALTLDALASTRARALRGELLHRTPATAPGPGTGPRTDQAPGVREPDDVLLRFDPSWVRYAPLTTSGLVTAAGALGVGSQVARPLIARAGRGVVDRAEGSSLAIVVPAGVLAVLATVSVLSVAAYLVSAWGFTLLRDRAGRSFQVRRGLFTTRETSVDADRLRGVEVHEPLGLRLASGARLQAIVVGLKRREDGSTPLSPAAPDAVVRGVAAAVLADPRPLTTPLVRHGPRATRRRYTRALSAATVLCLADVVAVLAGASAWLLVAVPLLLGGAALTARDRARRLGHALTDDCLVTRANCFRGRRDVLEIDGIIGWTIRQTYFQRRAGLCTLTATTAAGRQGYRVHDVPEEIAVAVTRRATTTLMEAFVR